MSARLEEQYGYGEDVTGRHFFLTNYIAFSDSSNHLNPKYINVTASGKRPANA
jgi:hypothetical protein